MQIQKELLELLACPICKGSLEHNDVIKSLDCKKCSKHFLIKDGIPVLLPDEALDFNSENITKRV